MLYTDIFSNMFQTVSHNIILSRVDEWFYMSIYIFITFDGTTQPLHCKNHVTIVSTPHNPTLDPMYIITKTWPEWRADSWLIVNKGWCQLLIHSTHYFHCRSDYIFSLHFLVPKFPILQNLGQKRCHNLEIRLILFKTFMKLRVLQHSLPPAHLEQ